MFWFQIVAEWIFLSIADSSRIKIFRELGKSCFRDLLPITWSRLLNSELNPVGNGVNAQYELDSMVYALRIQHARLGGTGNMDKNIARFRCKSQAREYHHWMMRN